jgi:hypothetical protein
MLLKAFLLPIAALTSFVAADGAAIVAAMTKVADQSIALNDTVASWDGNVFALLPILVDSTKLLADINAATDTAKASANLTVIEGFGVAQETTALSSIVQTTLATIVSKKDKFAELFLQVAILLELKAEKSATDSFAAAVTEKLPAALQGVAPSLIKPIDDAFDSAIASYESWSW